MFRLLVVFRSLASPSLLYSAETAFLPTIVKLPKSVKNSKTHQSLNKINMLLGAPYFFSSSSSDITLD